MPPDPPHTVWAPLFIFALGPHNPLGGPAVGGKGRQPVTILSLKNILCTKKCTRFQYKQYNDLVTCSYDVSECDLVHGQDYKLVQACNTSEVYVGFK